MLSRVKRSRLMLIRIKNGRFGFVLPLPLFILEDVVDACSDLIYVVEKVASNSRKLSLGTIIELSKQTIEELVIYGRWKMVDIEAKEVKVSIEFY
jgi:hypothetical protein